MAPNRAAWVGLRPGSTRDAGVIVLHSELEKLGREDEESEAIRRHLGADGSRFRWTEEGRDGALDALGIPPGTELLHVDEEGTSRMSIDEVVWRMTSDKRADSIWLGMRAPNGDLMDMRFDRPMFVAPSARAAMERRPQRTGPQGLEGSTGVVCANGLAQVGVVVLRHVRTLRRATRSRWRWWSPHLRV